VFNIENFKFQICSTKFFSLEESKSNNVIKESTQGPILFTSNANILQSTWWKFLKFLPHILTKALCKNCVVASIRWLQELYGLLAYLTTKIVWTTCIFELEILAFKFIFWYSNSSSSLPYSSWKIFVFYACKNYCKSYKIFFKIYKRWVIKFWTNHLSTFTKIKNIGFHFCSFLLDMEILTLRDLH